MPLKYLHTMIRVANLEKTIAFFELLGMQETRRHESEGGRFSLIFMAAPGMKTAQSSLLTIGTAMTGFHPTAAILATSPMLSMIFMKHAKP